MFILAPCADTDLGKDHSLCQLLIYGYTVCIISNGHKTATPKTVNMMGYTEGVVIVVGFHY